MKGGIGISVFAAILLSACFEEPRFKADTEANFSESFETITRTLSAEDKQKLDTALKDIVLVETELYGPLSEATVYRQISEKQGVGSSSELVQQFMGGFRPAFDASFGANWTANRAAAVVKNARSIVDGRTAKEIFTIAESERKKATDTALNIYRDQLEKANSALNDVQAEEEAAAQKQVEQKAILARIELTKSRFLIRRSGFLEQPTISFALANKGTIPVKRIFVHGKLQTPGRAVPWVDADFNYEFPGGVEPSETKELNLAPNMFSEWGKVPKEAVPGATLSLNLLVIEDAEGKRIGEDPAERERIKDRKKALEEGVRVVQQRIKNIDPAARFEPTTSTRPEQINTTLSEQPVASVHPTPIQSPPPASKAITADVEGGIAGRAVIEQPKWEISETKSSIDDSLQISGMLISEDGQSTLIMRCREKKTDLYITGTGFFGSTEPLRVLYRIDANKAVAARWAPSSNGQAAFVANPVAFIKSLTDNGTLFIRVHDFQGAGHDASFKLSDVSEIRSKVASICKWPTEANNTASTPTGAAPSLRPPQPPKTKPSAPLSLR